MQDSGMAHRMADFSPNSDSIFCNLESNQLWRKAGDFSESKGSSSSAWIESELLARNAKILESNIAPQSFDLEAETISTFNDPSRDNTDLLSGVNGQAPLVGSLSQSRTNIENGGAPSASIPQAATLAPYGAATAATGAGEKVIGETGTVTGFTHRSQTIQLEHDYINPVVFAQPLSFNGGQPAIVRIEDIQSDRFTAAIQEPSNLDGSHTAESFSYIVLEAGKWELDNGALLEVGTVDTRLMAKQGFETIDFSRSFNAAPAIFSQVQTDNGSDFVRTRQKDSSVDGFQLALEEEEAKQFSGHASETVGWLAMSTGQGDWNGHTYQVGQTGDTLTDKWRTLDFGSNLSGKPQFLASLASYDGKDPAGLRYRNLSGNSVQLKVEEDTSVDSETKHTTEQASFLAISGAGLLTAIDANGGGNPGNPNPDGIIFPDDAGVVDVKSYGAIPDDGKDDTAAIQQALNANPSGNHIFYFSDGVYDISNTLTIANQQKRNIFQGQSESGTVLRLMDSVNANFSGALIRTGGNNGNTTADRFRNSVRNLTLNIGVNHPNAKGLQFWANNQGTVKDVTILSEDGQGEIGLDMAFDDAIGPLFVQDLTVDGFDYGVKTRWQTASQTFEDITLTNQNVYGWWNTSSQRVFARNVQSVNAVTAIRNDGEAGFILVDSDLTGTGSAAANPAIINQKTMYVSNTQTAGYSLGVDNILNFGRGNPDAPVGYIDEFWANGSGPNRAGNPFELFSSPNAMLGLPVQETPEVPWETNLNNWDGPHRHVIGSSGVPNDGKDDTAAIQAAIDSGASTIYLPRGTWDLDGTLKLRGNVSRFLGTEANLRASDTGAIRVEDGAAPVVVIERLEGIKAIEHASDRTLVLNNLLGFQYVPAVTAPGDVFINDAVGSASTFKNQNVWARQLNIETNTQNNPAFDAKVLNDNSQVWILGMKSEDKGTVIKTINGGKTELLGNLHVGSGVSNANNPRFVTVDSSFSVAGIYGGGFTLMASETRNGVTRTADTFNLADVYTAYPPDKQ